MKIENREALTNVCQKTQEEIASYTCRVLVCAGTGCVASGSQKIYDRMKELCENVEGVSVEFQKEVPHLGTVKTGCQGICELGPLVRIEPAHYQYVKVQPEDCGEIFERTVLHGEPVERLFYHRNEKIYERPEEIPFIAGQTRIVLENCGKIDAESLEEYIAAGGFSALTKAFFDMTPEQVVEEVDRSGLRGRGGGGFPAGRKWKQVARQPEKVRYVVCNGDEGDPGAFMDGSVMEGDPYKLLEGMVIAAYAVQSHEGYIYVRAEYPLSVARLKHAIGEMEKAGLLGDNILGSGFSFHMHINRGAGAFVCGEGSALTASIEGNRGMPRVKPPRTVEQRGDVRQRAGHYPEGGRLVPHDRYGRQSGYQDVFHHGSDPEYRTDRSAHGNDTPGDYLRHRRRHQRRRKFQSSTDRRPVRRMPYLRTAGCGTGF